jgi:poly-gamma-glutamate capsule biosynthesis protein CapA/YwtB (metallophosphatase superfamily)
MGPSEKVQRMIPVIGRRITDATLPVAALRAAIACMSLLALLGPHIALAAEAEPGVVRIVFAGDVMLDGGPGHTIVHGGDPFAEFAGLLQGADIAVCNLECVLAEDGEQVLKPYTFRAPQESLPLLKRYFTALGLANNHTGDYGKDAFLRQLTTLENAKLPYFGGGRNRQQAHRPLILERHGMRVAILGYNDFQPRSFEAGENSPGTAWLVDDDVLADVNAARERDHADVVIPFLHWGRESLPEPIKWQRDFARQLIDAGATAIVGAHAHVTQTVDVYKGRPIVYSLGNFVFDYYPVDPEIWTGWIVRFTIRRTGEVDLETFVLQIDKAGTPHLLPASKEMLPK